LTHFEHVVYRVYIINEGILIEIHHKE